MRVLKRHLRTVSVETIHELKVTCQQTQVSHVSNTWAPTKEELHIKGMQRLVRVGQNLQILELTGCSHAGLFVNSQPRFTCPKQPISGSHTWARVIRLLRYSVNTSGNENRKGVCWRGTYVLFRWKKSMNSKSHANKQKLVTFLIPEHRRDSHCKLTTQDE